MIDQASATLITALVIVLLPSAVGVFVAQFGTGRALWVATTVALVFALASLIVLATALLGTAGDSPLGYQLAYCSLLVGVGACADALTRSVRTRHVAWCVALLALGASPLLASLAAFSFGALNGTASAPDEALAFTLLPLGPAALTVYGARLAMTPRRPRMAIP